MTGYRSQRPRLLILLWIGSMLLLAGTLALAFNSQASASPLPDPDTPGSSAGDTQQTSDADCLSCHADQGQTMQLPSQEQLYISIDPEAFTKSIHGEAQTKCVDCHTNITGYPHPEFTAQDLRDVAILLYPTCEECHEEKFHQGADSVHQSALANGNKDAAVCSDCHNPHVQGRLINPDTGSMLAEERVQVPQTCARCHNAIFEEYATSAHGDLVLTTGNVDVPTCTECHGVHNIPNPTTAEFRLRSPQLCADCHVDEVKMAKYGLSTQVLDTYVSDFHGTTVALFRKQSPDQASNQPVCYDCHSAHQIARVDDPQRGLQIKENILISCKRCHPDATENFPDAWLSHYIPSPAQAPLVYYVNLFYWIVIPLVIGIMAAFVISDFIRRQQEKPKRKVAHG